MVSSTPRPHFTPGKDPVPIVRLDVFYIIVIIIIIIIIIIILGEVCKRKKLPLYRPEQALLLREF